MVVEIGDGHRGGREKGAFNVKMIYSCARCLVVRDAMSNVGDMRREEEKLG